VYQLAELDIVMANLYVCPSASHTLVLYLNQCIYHQTLDIVIYGHDPSLFECCHCYKMPVGHKYMGWEKLAIFS